MAFPSVTYTFANSTTADATQVNQNFTDLINGASDGTKNYNISALTAGGTATLSGAVVLGAGTPNDITFNGSLASSVPIKTNTTYDIGTSTLGLQSIYFGAGSTKTVRVIGPSLTGTSYTFKLPDGAGSSGQVLSTDGSGNTSWIAAAGDKLVMTSNSPVVTLTAGEAISARDAVCLDLSAGSYAVFKCDYTKTFRRSTFFGFAQAAASSSNPVTIQFGGALGGFTSLTVGAIYYIGNTAGAITTAPSDTSPVVACQAIASDTIWIPLRQQIFATPEALFRSHGTTTRVNDGSTGVGDGETFNYSSWSAITADTNARANNPIGEDYLLGNHLTIDGRATSTTITLLTSIFNKTSWTTGSTRSLAKQWSGAGNIGSVHYVGKGYTSGAAITNTIDSWNATSWSNGVGTLGSSRQAPGCFLYSSLVHWLGGNDTVSDATNHDTFNGASVSTDTVTPLTASFSGGARSGTGLSAILFAANQSSTASYKWTGSWSASIAMPTAINTASGGANLGGASGYSGVGSMAYCQGGASISNCVNNTQQFNDTSWASGTVSSNSRANSAAAAF